MGNSRVISFSLPAPMLEAAEAMARHENRTMSELMREAFRVYQRERQSWEGVFAYGEANAKRIGVRGDRDVVRIVRESRRQRRNPVEMSRKARAK